eukprot:CAMPEP_0172359368 /NCGR_PEP_ID=MMETSP1060-20121228/3578_1 /TAXON_ID=37318 /ORGANISM="Pseudo-nitzschia pungens, Strain cf. cingulata" /LENGTH=198 /DNA_ID=CAMNT_0013080985 /DNA_START=78 /DNA_END=674 /DNA_ORIENTATION=+
MESTPCRTAMNNLEALLKSYNRCNEGRSIEYLFNDTFDPAIRMHLNGQRYNRDFLMYQNTQNSARGLQVKNIVMEPLDNASFHYTFQVVNCFNTKDSDHNDDKICMFHSFATVENGKIVKIKPMTGLAYMKLFAHNINCHRAQINRGKTLTRGQRQLTTSTKIWSRKRFSLLGSSLSRWSRRTIVSLCPEIDPLSRRR